MKSKLLWFFILSLCLGRQLVAQAPPWQWAKEANSPQNERAWDISTDPSSGNVFVGGSFNGGLASAYGTSLAATYGQTDGFLAKYDASGNVLWAIKIGGANIEEVKSVAADPSGNVYVAGYFRSVCDFDPSATAYTLSPAGGAGNQDGFLAKYDGLGNLLWATKFGNNSSEDVWRISADANGVYLTGNCFGSVTFNSASPSVITKTTTANQGFSEFYGAKYNSLGVVQWAISGSSQKDDIGYDVVADNNNLYFIGTCEKDMDFYNANGTFAQQLQVASNNHSSIFIAAFTQSTGTLAWVTGAGSLNNDDTGNGITQDNTNLYITGTYKGSINFPISTPLFTKTSSGNIDMFVAKLSKSTGIFQWVSAQTCTGGGDEAGYEAEMDASGNVVVAGYFNSAITFTAGPSFSSSGNEDILLSAYSPAGALLWASKAGGNNADVTYGLATATNGAVYVAGQHADATVFGTTTLTTGGGENIFVAKTGCMAISNNTIASSQTVCASVAPASLTGSAPVGGNTYVWEKSLNNSTWSNAPGTFTNQNYAPATLTATTYYRRSVSGGTGCSNATPSNTITITVDQPPTTANAGSSQTLCASISSLVLSGNAPTVGAGTWSVISGAGTINAPGLANATITALGTGSNVLRWSISNGVCAASQSTVLIKIDNVPTSPIAGNNQTLCVSTPTALLTGNVPTVGTGLWTVQSGNAIIVQPSSATTAVTGIDPGITTFAWTISNGVCPPAASTKSIQADNLPTAANAGTSQTVCINTSSLVLAGNMPVIGSGAWSVLSGSATLANPLTPSASLSNYNQGTIVLQWSISNGACAVSSSTKTVQVDALPDIADGGSNQVICAATSAFTGTMPTVGSGLWSIISGSASIAAPNSPLSSLSGIATGTNIFVWSVSNGVCPVSSATVSIQRDAVPTPASAGANQTLCISSPTAALNGNVPAVGSGSWSVAGGSGSIASSGSPVTVVSGLTAGLNTLNWTIGNGVCAPNSSTVTIQVDNLPSVPVAGSNQTLCINSPSTNLTANFPAVGTGLWTVQSGGAVIASPNQPLSVITGLNAGLTVLAWTITNGVCAPLTSTKTIQVDHMPTPASAGSNQTVCASTGSVNLNGNAPAIGSGLWTNAFGNGVIALPSQAGSSVSSLGTGTNIFQWTITNGICPASTASVTIQVDAVPTTPVAGNNQTICATSPTAVLAANSPLVGAGAWTAQNSGIVIASPASATTSAAGLTPGINIFVWTISNGVCSAQSSTQTIQLDQVPDVAVAGGSQTLCISSPTALLNANVPVVGAGSWSLISGSGSISSPTLASTSVVNLGQGINLLNWTIGNGICPASSSTVTIQVDDLPTVPSAGSNQTLCINSPSANLSGNVPIVGTGQWSMQSGGGVFSSPALAATSVTGLSPGINVLGWTITNGVCAPLTATKTIQVDQMPTAASAGPAQTVCASSASVVLNGNVPVIGSGSWSGVSGSGVISSPAQANSTVSSLSTGINMLQWMISNGACPPSVATVTIQVDAVPTGPVAGSNQTLCINSPTAALFGNVPAIGTGLWTVQNGSAVIASPSSPTTTVSSLAPGLTLLAWTISNGVCTPLTSTKTIQVDQMPGAAIAGPSQTICISSPSFVLGANAPAVGTGSWSVLSGGCSIITPTSPASTILNLLPGPLVLNWEIRNGVCPVSSATTGLLVDALPSAAFAGNNTTLCAAGATLTASAPLIGTGSWMLIQGSGQLVQPQQPITSVNGLSGGENKFVWTVANGSCPPRADTVAITRDLMPDAALAGRDTLICGSAFILNANSPSTGSGQWSLLSGNGSIASGMSFSTPVSSLGTGANVFLWKISSGSCAPSYDTVIIKTDAPPSVAIAGTSQRVCAATVTLSSNAPLVGMGSWSIVEGNAQILDSLQSNTRVTLPDTNAVRLRWTIKNGICADSESEITIKRDVEPDQAIAGTDQQVETPVAMLIASQPVIGRGHWQVIQGDAILDDAAKASTQAGSLSTGNNIFRWTVENGVCPASTDDIIIYLEPLKIPTGFSPNGDNINDMYVIPGLDYYDHADFSVFNRWGGLVYHNASYKNEWAGTNQHHEPLADDTYYFTLKISATMDYSGYIIIKTTK